MKTILFALLLGSQCFASDLYTEINGNGLYTVAQQDEADRRVRALERELENAGLPKLAEVSLRGLDGIMYLTQKNLIRRGHRELAQELADGFEFHREDLFIISLGGRPIGSFDGISSFISEWYLKVENALGLEICRAIRLSDLYSLNHGLKVVFSPCQYGLEEFKLHFIHDAKYRGVLPVLAYWASNITCMVGTFGMGVIGFICSPVSMLVELAVDRKLAPWLAPKIYARACD